MAEIGEGVRLELERVPARRSLLVERVIEPVVKRLGWKAAAVPLLAMFAACSQGGDEVSPAGVSQPPTITPTAAGTIEATVTPRQTPSEITPTPRSATPSPETTTTAEKKPASHWEVIVDPALENKPSRFRSTNEDLAIINRVSENFPKIGDLKIILSSRKVGSIDLQHTPEAIIYLSSEALPLEPHAYHEFGHFFDVTINAERLRPFYTREDWKRLFELRAAIVAKHKNFPQIEKMFSSQKIGSTDSPENLLTRYPDALFIDHTRVVSETNLPSQEPLFASLLADPILDRFVQETKGQRHGYLNLGQFLKGEIARIDQLKATNPYWRLGLAMLETKLNYLANWQWSAGTGLPLDDKYLDRYFAEVLPLYARMALTQALAEDNRQLLALLGPEETAKKKEEYWRIYFAASNELFAEVYSRQQAGLVPMEDGVVQYHNLINKAKP